MNVKLPELPSFKLPLGFGNLKDPGPPSARFKIHYPDEYPLPKLTIWQLLASYLG